MTKNQPKINVISMTVIIVLMLFISLPAVAGEFQSPPKDYLFGNHFDSHQETKLKRDKTGNPESLNGSLYIIFTGAIESGLPVARHPGSSEDCNLPETGCVVGWSIAAVPGYAKFLYQGGVNIEDHAFWMWNRADFPQPGSFTHFHWLTEGVGEFPSSLAEVEMVFDQQIQVPGECNVAMASQLTSGVECPGYFLEITALEPFGYKEWAFHHGGESLVVRSGIDNMTHLNLVTSYRSLPPDVLPGDYAAGNGGHHGE